MIRTIIDVSLKNRFLVLTATIIAVAVGLWSMKNTPLDAIPDLSDVQVIVFTEYAGQAPQVVEDQVTYPLTTAMLAVPNAKVVRGYSFFGFSFVYIIFDDGTDMYWARSRVLEYLNYVSGRLPVGVSPSLGPDATGVGWVYEYALVDTRLVFTLSFANRRRRVGSCIGGRLCQTISSRSRSQRFAGLQHSPGQGKASDQAFE